MSIVISLTGDDLAFRRLQGVEDRLGQLSVPMGITANLLEAHVATIFRTKGAHIGRRWPGLRPRTVVARRRGYGYYGDVSPKGARPTGPPLVWSGKFRRSFLRGGIGHIRVVHNAGLRWGSADVRGKFHDSDAPRRRLPQRKILAFRDRQQRQEIITRPARLWIMGVPRGAIETVAQARAGIL